MGDPIDDPIGGPEAGLDGRDIGKIGGMGFIGGSVRGCMVPQEQEEAFAFEGPGHGTPETGSAVSLRGIAGWLIDSAIRHGMVMSL